MHFYILQKSARIRQTGAFGDASKVEPGPAGAGSLSADAWLLSKLTPLVETSINPGGVEFQVGSSPFGSIYPLILFGVDLSACEALIQVLIYPTTKNQTKKPDWMFKGSVQQSTQASLYFAAAVSN